LVYPCHPRKFYTDDLMTIKPINEKIDELFDYILQHNIQEDCTFPPTMWAEFISSLERTTNCCESFHSQFNRHFYSPKPNIFQFIDVLKEIQILKNVCKTSKYRKSSGHKIYSKTSTHQNWDGKMKKNEITRIQYLTNICYTFLPQ
jgi:hypothetical protein